MYNQESLVEKIMNAAATKSLDFEHRGLAMALESYTIEELAWALAGIIQETTLKE